MITIINLVPKLNKVSCYSHSQDIPKTQYIPDEELQLLLEATKASMPSMTIFVNNKCWYKGWMGEQAIKRLEDKLHNNIN